MHNIQYVDRIEIIKYLKVLQHVTDQRIHHRGALYSAWLKITRMILSCSVMWTWSVLWQNILTRCACVQFTVYEGTAFIYINGHDRIILVIFSQALYKAL